MSQPKCMHCRGKIRWRESMGWVHGEPGDPLYAYCDKTKTTEAEWDLDDY